MKVYYKKVSGSREEFIVKILDLFEQEIDSAVNILLKPNIVSLEEYPTTTHTETVSTILSWLKRKNKEIAVADGPAYSLRKNKVIRKHALAGICREYKVPLIDLNRTSMKTFKHIDGLSYTYRISQYAFQFDYIISLPVLKIHNDADVGFTGALKNQYGFFSGRDKLRGHFIKNALNFFITEINTIIKPQLFIVDAVKVLIHANERRHGGREAELGFMFAGKDPVALDTFGFSLLKKLNDSKLKDSIYDVGYVVMAGNKKLGSFIYEPTEI